MLPSGWKKLADAMECGAQKKLTLPTWLTAQRRTSGAKSWWTTQLQRYNGRLICCPYSQTTGSRHLRAGVPLYAGLRTSWVRSRTSASLRHRIDVCSSSSTTGVSILALTLLLLARPQTCLTIRACRLYGLTGISVMVSAICLYAATARCLWE